MIGTFLLSVLLSVCAVSPQNEDEIDLLKHADEIASLSSENAKTFDMHDGTYLFVGGIGSSSGESSRGVVSSSGTVIDKGIIVGNPTPDNDDDPTFVIGKMNTFGQTTESKAVYLITLPDLDYRAVVSATLSIRAMTTGTLSTLNFYETEANYNGINGIDPFSVTLIDTVTLTASYRFIADITTEVTDHLDAEKKNICLVAAGAQSVGVRTIYTDSAANAYKPVVTIRYQAPSVAGTGAASAYSYLNDTGTNCWAYALGLTGTWIDHSVLLYSNMPTLNQGSFDEYLLPDLVDVVRNEGFHIRKIADEFALIYAYEWRIAYRPGRWNYSFTTFHFMVQTSDDSGRWAEKPGSSQSSQLAIGASPSNSSLWQDWRLQGSPTTYFAISH